MVTFDFKVVLDKAKIDEAGADALYARCKDGTLITAAGITYMDLDRQANSLDEAVRSAIADINAAGFHVVRIEIEADWALWSLVVSLASSSSCFISSARRPAPRWPSQSAVR